MKDFHGMTRHATLILTWTSLLAGCAGTGNPVLPAEGPTMKSIYDRHMTAVHSAERRTDAGYRPLPASGFAHYRGYLREAASEIDSLFPRLPNPTLVMYVYPHLSRTERTPVPGYATSFPLHERVEYALPGEVPMLTDSRYRTDWQAAASAPDQLHGRSFAEAVAAVAAEAESGELSGDNTAKNVAACREGNSAAEPDRAGIRPETDSEPAGSPESAPIESGADSERNAGMDTAPGSTARCEVNIGSEPDAVSGSGMAGENHGRSGSGPGAAARIIRRAVSWLLN